MDEPPSSLGPFSSALSSTFLGAFIGSAAGSAVALSAALLTPDLDFGDAFIYLGNPLSGGFALLGGAVGLWLATRRGAAPRGLAGWFGCLLMVPAAWFLTLLAWAAMAVGSNFGN